MPHISENLKFKCNLASKRNVTYKLLISNVVLLCYCFNHVPSISIRKSQPSLYEEIKEIQNSKEVTHVYVYGEGMEKGKKEKKKWIKRMHYHV